MQVKHYSKKKLSKKLYNALESVFFFIFFIIMKVAILLVAALVGLSYAGPSLSVATNHNGREMNSVD
jgi:hypothetical protein